jgi:octaprenyl-diphosphate synthase
VQRIRALVTADLEALDTLIREQLRSDVVLVNQVGHYIVEGGGKRLRPLLVLLAARACGYQGRDHVPVAAIVEFIHTATLLHDDVVDESDRRRGRDTANARWGNAASVLVGDFLYSRAFQMMVEVDSMRVMGILADTTNTIAEGEVMQLMHAGDPDTDETSYLRVIDSKTARLFEAATRLGAVLTGRPEAEERALADYGRHLGTAFQIADDVLDYSADGEALGKNLGDDLAEGKATLPLIHAMRDSDGEQLALLRRAVETGDRSLLPQVVEAIRTTGALEAAGERARSEAGAAREALDSLPGSDYRDAMISLADYAVERTF